MLGIWMLDPTQVMAGPVCSMLLADPGGDVVKIGSPDGGDQTRGSAGFEMMGSDSLGLLDLNRNTLRSGDPRSEPQQ